MKAVEKAGPAPTILSRSTLRRGLASFAALTVAGLGGVYVYGLRVQAEDVVTSLSGMFFALALLAALFDWFLGGLRHHLFLRRLVPGSRLWLPIRADLVGRFTGAVTPSQTGGGPGQIFMLYRGGIPLPAILSTLTLNLMATMVFFVFVGGAAVWIVHAQVSSIVIRQLVLWGFIAVAGLCAFLAVALTRPDVAARPIAWLTSRLEGRTGGLARTIVRVGAALVESVERYERACTRCLREWPMLPPIAVALTLLMYLNKFTLGWFVVRGLGFDAPYLPTLAIQAVLHLILYAAPTPGGSGIAEVSTGALMALLLPAPLLGPFTLAYRFFLTYLPAAVGAALLAHDLRPRGAVERQRAPAVAAGLLLTVLASTLGTEAVAGQARAGHMDLVVPIDSVAVGRHARYRGMAETARRVLERGVTASSRLDSLEAFDRAVQLGAGLVQIAPNDADAHYLYSVALGQRLELSGTREKIRLGQRCREEAERALALDPDHAGAHHVLGRLNAATMRLSRITRFIARRLLGAKALEGASWDVAEQHFLHAARVEPENPRNWLELGSLYIDTGRPEPARAALRRAVAITPNWDSERVVVERARQALESLDCSGC